VKREAEAALQLLKLFVQEERKSRQQFPATRISFPLNCSSRAISYLRAIILSRQSAGRLTRGAVRRDASGTATREGRGTGTGKRDFSRDIALGATPREF